MKEQSELEERIRVFRDLERSIAEQPDPPVLLLGSIRELLMQAEAELHDVESRR